VPTEKLCVKFDQFDKLTMANFLIYYDFETMLVQEDTMNRKIHKPIAVAAKRVCAPNSALNSPLYHYVGIDCVEKFLNWLEQQENEMQCIQNIHYVPLQMTSEDRKLFSLSGKCKICQCKFGPLNPPYRDHCHLSGKFRGCLCNRCNLTYASEKKLTVPCLAHGATRFDQHLFVKALVLRNKEKNLSPPKILPLNTEHYKAIFNSCFVFLDSYEFMKSSLAAIVQSMQEKNTTMGLSNAFPLLMEYVENSGEKFQLLSRKGVFSYDFLDKKEKLNLQRLPTKEEFYDSLHQTHISNADYEHAQRVWTIMGCKTLQDYLLIYLDTDVLLLGDCFEKFRQLTMSTFHLDVGKFLTLPHFAYHAMLKQSGVQLDIMTDVEMYMFCKKNIRGGVASIMQRYAEANVPEMGQDYDSSKPRCEIIALDCNNLYGHALSQALPEKDFHWLSENEIETLDILSIAAEAEIGYILSVDLNYPPKLHEKHSMYPLAPEKISVPPAIWSEYACMLAREFENANFFKTGAEKLIPHLGNRQHYVLHYRNLQTYIKYGMRLVRVHRVLAFKQRAWMRPFVKFITEKRQKSVSDFESNCWKLTLNSIYGRFLMNPDKRINMKLVHTESIFQKLVGQPRFKSATIYDPSFAGVQLLPVDPVLKNPVAVGFCVLELSKNHMYLFHYNFIQKVLGGLGHCDLLMTDTDSLIYAVQNVNPKKLFVECAPKYFDFSNFPPDHPLFSAVNRKIKGAFKFEYPAQIIKKFIGIRAKMYCFEFHESKRQAKAKGIPKVALKGLDFKDYYRALFHPEIPQRCQYHTIQSQKHCIFTLYKDKKGLSCLDLKRYICPNGIDTFAYGDIRCTTLAPFSACDEDTSD
jgi:hypothetical protein